MARCCARSRFEETPFVTFASVIFRMRCAASTFCLAMAMRSRSASTVEIGVGDVGGDGQPHDALRIERGARRILRRAQIVLRQAPEIEFIARIERNAERVADGVDGRERGGGADGLRMPGSAAAEMRAAGAARAADVGCFEPAREASASRSRVGKSAEAASPVWPRACSTRAGGRGEIEIVLLGGGLERRQFRAGETRPPIGRRPSLVALGDRRREGAGHLLRLERHGRVGRTGSDGEPRKPQGNRAQQNSHRMTHSKWRWAPTYIEASLRKTSPGLRSVPQNRSETCFCGESWAAGPWTDVGASKRDPAALAPYPSLGNAEEARARERVSPRGDAAQPHYCNDMSRIPAAPEVATKNR